MSRIVIFANGELPDPQSARMLLREGDFLIAADGGARHLLDLGLLPNIVIGDLDSVDEDTLFELTSAGVEIIQYSEDKDESDLELALHYAGELRPRSILVVGALGGRLDQTLASLALLTGPEFSRLDIRLDDGIEEAFYCQASSPDGGQVQIQGKSGDTVSLIPWGGRVEGVVTQGLKWVLSGETLYPFKTRGLSNILLEEKALVKIKSGLLLVIHQRKQALGN